MRKLSPRGESRQSPFVFVRLSVPLLVCARGRAIGGALLSVGSRTSSSGSKQIREGGGLFRGKKRGLPTSLVKGGVKKSGKQRGEEGGSPLFLKENCAFF